jgi:hydroxyacylglutathione hydrolase
VIETPGHCPDHVAYWSSPEKVVFVGDTLFALGCGRMFNSTPTEFWTSLQKLASLPDDTQVYCGHEYTLANARFAVSVDPTNPALRARVSEVEALRANGQVTLPTSIGIERATNPFLRAEDAAIRATLGLTGAAAAEVFAELRERKNRF